MLAEEGVRALIEGVGNQFVIRVSDGTAVASTIANTVDIRAFEEDGHRYVALHVEGEFESTFANFDWRRRDVAIVVPMGSDITLDRQEIDLGRKVEGSVWTVVADVAFEVSSS